MSNQTIARCPHCKHPIILSAQTPTSPSLSSWPFTPHGRQDGPQKTTFQHAAPYQSDVATPDIELPGDWERVTPIGRLEPRDVTTAVYDAAVSFGLVTIALGSLIFFLDGQIRLEMGGALWRILLAWWLAPAGGLAVSLWRYFGGLALAKTLLEIVETVTRIDINRDDFIEALEPRTVRVEAKGEKGNWIIDEFEIEPNRLRAFTVEVAHGQSFSERTATGCGLTQVEFGLLRDKFIKHNWARWNHPHRRQQGVSLTLVGQLIMEEIAGAKTGQNGREEGQEAGHYAFMEGMR